MGSKGSYCWGLLQQVSFSSKLLVEIFLRGNKCFLDQSLDGSTICVFCWGRSGFVFCGWTPVEEIYMGLWGGGLHFKSWTSLLWVCTQPSEFLSQCRLFWHQSESFWPSRRLRPLLFRLAKADYTPGRPSGLETWFSPVLGLVTSFSSSINFTVFSWGFKWLNNVIMAVFNRKWFCLFCFVFFPFHSIFFSGSFHLICFTASVTSRKKKIQLWKP